MTDTIDLDEEEFDEDEPEREANPGDWLWRGEGDPADEPTSRWGNGSTDEGAAAGDEDGTTVGDESTTTDTGDGTTDRPPTPKVPGEPDGPVGVPEERGGSGGGSPSRQQSRESDSSTRATDHGEETTADDMTLAFTYEAVHRLANPQFAVADARGWADWIGIVGTVSTPAIRKFQRDAGIDLDFFGGSESGPANRLADVTEESMFYAERMVLVGADDQEWIATEADWEFVPLETAAENADWEIEFEE